MKFWEEQKRIYLHSLIFSIKKSEKKDLSRSMEETKRDKTIKKKHNYDRKRWRETERKKKAGKCIFSDICKGLLYSRAFWNWRIWFKDPKDWKPFQVKKERKRLLFFVLFFSVFFSSQKKPQRKNKKETKTKYEKTNKKWKKKKKRKTQKERKWERRKRSFRVCQFSRHSENVKKKSASFCFFFSFYFAGSVFFLIFGRVLKRTGYGHKWKTNRGSALLEDVEITPQYKL